MDMTCRWINSSWNFDWSKITYCCNEINEVSYYVKNILSWIMPKCFILKMFYYTGWQNKM